MNIIELTEEIAKQLNEVKPMRAWNGKLSRIDDLIAWMYDKNILTASDKKKKDSLFHKYYRYYNDGDFPRGIKTVDANQYRWSRTGSSSWKKEIEDKIEYELEQQLENFISYILSKYLPRIDRKDFRYDNAISKINDVLEVLKDNNFLSINSIDYFSKAVKTDNPQVTELLEELKTLYERYKEIAKNVKDPNGWTPDSTFDNKVYGYGRDEIRKQSPEAAQLIDDIEIVLTKLRNFYNNLKIATIQAYEISKE